MTHARQEFGSRGEELACSELERLGYAILERRYRCRLGEIDIIARDGDVTVFVEVKARESGEFGGGAAAVTPAKQRTVARVATDYIARHRLFDRPCRFDVVVVDSAATVTVIPNAFESYA
jgi:putative endonuclease